MLTTYGGGGGCVWKRDSEARKRTGEKTRRTRWRAGQAVGLTQQEGLFNKHELEPSAIECYNAKLMQMRAELMTKWSGERKERRERLNKEREAEEREWCLSVCDGV